MNAERRAELAAHEESLSKVCEDLERLKDMEDEALENLPEGLQDSKRGQAMETAIQELDDAIELLNDAIEHLKEAAA